MTLKLINVPDHGPIAGDSPLITNLQSLGWQGARIRLPKTTTVAQADLDYINGMMTLRFKPLVIFWNPTQLSALPKGVMAELRNEPNIQTDIYTAPADYAKLADACVPLAATQGVQLYVGACGDISYTQQFLAAMQNKTGYGVTRHRYPMGNTPDVTQAPYSSRFEEENAWREIIWPRPWAISEVGYWTAPRVSRYMLFGFIPLWNITQTWTDQQVADYAGWEFELYSAYQADFVAWYELNDGPLSTQKEQTFGIRYFGPNPWNWKPVANTAQWPMNQFTKPSA